MYLKKLYISGFKSFANPSQLEFDREVSAIVGPNGSGKSNISDAIRFVLGEQRTKQMRSQRMEDIIFSGTRTERARGAAEVRLILDRENDPDLIIARKLFRTGESSYYINGKRVRLKDILALFTDTGLGRNGYSIVSQGGVDNIIGASPREIREMVEEAAGIAGFRARRDETQQRLKDTQENIDRIRDILDEINRQMSPLKRQADKTRRYLEINEILRVIDLVSFYEKQTHNFREIDELKTNLNHSLVNIENLDKETEKEDELYRTSKENISALRSQVEALEAEIKAHRENLAEQREKRLTHEKANEYNSRESTRLSGEKIKLAEEIEGLEKELKETGIQLKQLSEETHKKETALNSQKELLTEYEDDLNTLNNRKEEIDRKKEKYQKEQGELSNLLLTLKAEETGISLKSENIKDQKAQTTQRLESLELEINAAQDKLNEKTLQESKQLGELTNLRSENDNIQKKFQSLFQRIEQLKAHSASIESQIAYHEQMRENYSGYQSSVRSVMFYAKKFNNQEVFGPAADLFEVEEKYALALQVALGAKAQNIIVKNENVAKELIEYLKRERKGRATFLPLTSLRYNLISQKEKAQMQKERGFIGIASELITFDSKLVRAFESLLGRVVVLEDFQSASLFRKSYPRYTIVTLTGEIFYPGGAVVGGSTGKEGKTVLLQSVETQKLRDKFNEEQNMAEKLTRDYNALKSAFTKQEEAIKKDQIRLNALRQEIFGLKEQIKNKTQELSETRKKVSSLEREESDAEVEKLKKRIESTEHRIEEINELIREENDIDEQPLREKIIKQHEKIAQAEIAYKLAEQEEKNQYNSKEELSGNIKEVRDKLSNISLQLDKLDKEQYKHQEKLEIINDEISDLNKKIQEEEEKLKRIKVQLNKLEQSLNTLESRIKDLGRARSTEVEAKNKAERRLERLDLERKNLKTNIFELYGMNYTMVKEQIEDLEEKLDDYENEDIPALRKEFKSIGMINPQAIEEYQILKERHDNLNSQYKDLITAEKNIQNTIETLNQSMAEKFSDRFTVLNEHFSHTFSTLFEGGKASLNYTDPQDVLGSGIELYAQPPGKNLKSLNLLSGGEKAMTAIALLFAFIELNPAPFTIIDEIDAALDDSNIYRFTRYIEQMSSHNQFIIITHRKTTLRICDKINGVSMAANGISKLCSIQLSDYVELESESTPSSTV